MKTIDLDQVSLEWCVTVAQGERLVILRDGKPVALMIGVEGLDEEQLQLGSSDRFWTVMGALERLAAGETIDEIVCGYRGRVTREAIIEAISC